MGNTNSSDRGVASRRHSEDFGLSGLNPTTSYATRNAQGRERSDSVGSSSSNSTRSRANSQTLTPIIPPAAGKRRSSPATHFPLVSETDSPVKLAFPRGENLDLPGHAPPPIPANIQLPPMHTPHHPIVKTDSDGDVIISGHGASAQSLKSTSTTSMKSSDESGHRVKRTKASTSPDSMDDVPTRTIILEPVDTSPKPSLPLDIPTREVTQIFPPYEAEDASALVERILSESKMSTSGVLKWMQEQGAKLLGPKKTKLEESEALVRDYCTSHDIEFTAEHAEAVKDYVEGKPRQQHGMGEQMVDPSAYRNSALIIHTPSTLNPISQKPKKKVIAVILSWSGGGKVVYVTGSFNDWTQKVRLVKSDEDFSTILDLERGIHHFKFIVDEEWRCSEELPSAPDEDGHLVNYLEVVDSYGRSMGDGLDDLAEDEAGSGADSSDEEFKRHRRSVSLERDVGGERLSRTESMTSDGGNSPIESYAREIPREFYAELNPGVALPPPAIQSSTKSTDVFADPPLPLPPQLEKVVLNQSASVSNRVMDGVDPDFLPVPNHVTLNHLYACSIRDGVMAVAGSTRYRKKVCIVHSLTNNGVCYDGVLQAYLH
jgi:hypothetical protein